MEQATTESAEPPVPNDEEQDPPAAQSKPPAPPPVAIRISRIHLIVGNIFILAVLAAYYFGIFVGWQIALGIVFAFLLGRFDMVRRIRSLRRWYEEPRYAEIRKFFDTDQNARVQANIDFVTTVDPLHSWGTTALPTFLVALIIVYPVFQDISAWLHSWFWLLRWLASGVAALTTLTLFWSILLYTWVTPGIPTLDYARLRESADALQGLNAEDYNDVELIGEISRLDSLQRRIESYTTESALLSGLSFSSFLAIYFADKQEYRDNVASLFPVQLIEYPVPWTGNLPLIDQLRSIWLPSAAFLEAHVVGVISLALLCSAISFLGVLVARLPFNDGYREADRQLKGARLLNDKENQAIARDERHRVHNLSLAISQLRGNANMLRRGMEPTIQFMVFSRRAGLASFTLALMLCGTFFNSEIGAVILLVVLTVLAGGAVVRLWRATYRKHLTIGIGQLLGYGE